MVSAFKTLIKLGALDSTNAEITKIGKQMSIFPTDPIYSKLLITSLKSDY
jgi:HrpA-like RNA helicase